MIGTESLNGLKGRLRLWRRIGTWTLAALCLAAAAPAAGASEPDAYRIVAVGDSVTAGYQPGMTLTSVPYGYVDRLYEQALFRGRAEASNYGIVTLRTDGLVGLLQGARDGAVLTAEQLGIEPGLDPQVAEHANGVGGRTAGLRDDLAAADLVVVTIGANDFLGFFRELLTMEEEDAMRAMRQSIGDRMNNYAKKAEEALRLLRELAPNATILTADLYVPLPRFIAPELYDYLHESVVAPLSGALERLAQSMREEGADVRLVPLGEAFRGRELAWTNIADGDNHPTDAGYEAIAERFAAAIWDGYRVPADRPDGVPLTVVIGGTELRPSFAPVVANGTTFVALTDLSRALGATLQWEQRTRTAVFRKDGREVAVTIGAPTMNVNGSPVKLNAPAHLRTIDGAAKTYVPLAVIARGLDYQVEYRPKLRAAFVNP